MKPAAVVTIMALIAVCVTEMVMLARRDVPAFELAHELIELRRSNVERREFCDFYGLSLLTIEHQLQRSKDEATLASAASKLDLLTSREFLPLCDVLDPAQVGRRKANTLVCWADRDYECLASFTQLLLFSVQLPAPKGPRP